MKLTCRRGGQSLTETAREQKNPGARRYICSGGFGLGATLYPD
jgi:hypothetical protein